MEKALNKRATSKDTCLALSPSSDLIRHYEDQDELFDDFKHIAAWLASKQSLHTRRAYRYEIEQFLILVRKPLKKVEPTDLAAYLLTRDRMSVASKRRAKDSLSSFFNYLVKSRYISFSPADSLTQIKVPSKIERRVLSQELIVSAIKYEPSKRNQTLLELIYISGIRREEASKLRFSDFKRLKRSVMLVVTGKGSKTRVVNLPLRFWELVQALRPNGLQTDNMAIFRSSWRSQGLTDKQIYRIIKSALVRVGAPLDAATHWLRHSHATHALQKGANIRKVQTTLGHESLTTTQLYLHMDEGESSAMDLDWQDE